MKVIFLEHVLHVAKAGEVKEVSSGYASNYLFPKKLAQVYTPAIEKRLQDTERKKESDRRVLLGEKQQIIDTLSGECFEFCFSSGDAKTYGSIGAKDIVEYIRKKYHFPLTKKHIVFLGAHSRFTSIGTYDIYIDLGENYAGKAKVSIL